MESHGEAVDRRWAKMVAMQPRPHAPTEAPTQSPTARLFVALWPDAAVRGELQRLQQAWSWPAGAALTPPERLHLTLHFIGDLARGQVLEVADALAGVAMAPVELLLDTAEVWAGGVAVLRASAVPAALQRLHLDVRTAVEQALGVPGERRRFKPHVTLARKAGAALPSGAPLALRWRTDRFALVESASGVYRTLRAFSAGSSAGDPSHRRRSPP